MTRAGRYVATAASWRAGTSVAHWVPGPQGLPSASTSATPVAGQLPRVARSDGGQSGDARGWGSAAARRTSTRNARRRGQARAGEQRRQVEARQALRRPCSPAKAILVFDCETSTDPSEALTFGCYHYYRLDWAAPGPTLNCVDEGLFHADDLARHDRAAYETLAAYAATRQPASDLRVADANRSLVPLTRAEFVEEVFFPALSARATVVTFNAHFDLSRLATGWGEARGKHFEGGFSFPLATYARDGGESENRYRPRVRIRPFDSKRARLGLTRTPRGADPDANARGRGAFLDLRTLAYALSGQSHSLESACAAFGVPYVKRPVAHGSVSGDYIDYCREDVAATADLYRALACEYEQWGLARAPTRVYSPASLAKAYLQEAGIVSVLKRQPDFPVEVLGYSMVAYYGGRAEARVRRVPIPVIYVDFASMYPTVAALLDLWRFFSCQEVEIVEEDAAEAERWIAQLTLDDVLDPAVWTSLFGLALVEPHGEILPVRARWARAGSYGIGLNPVSSHEPLWYTLPDLLGGRTLGEMPPRILRVLRFKPKGVAAGLRPMRIRGSRPIDPNREDVFRALVEEHRRHKLSGDPESLRTAAALKTVANSAAYGITVELNRQEARTERVSVIAHGLDRFQADAPAYEEPGVFFFPPLGAIVTGAARLMLALLERLLTDAGGAYAFCDTDSMAIIATETGGPVPCAGGRAHDENGQECLQALTWAQVDEIIARFTRLNPYDPELVPGSILELEAENLDPATGKQRQLYSYPISAKRYCLYTLDDDAEPVLVKWSEHGLGGFYLNPTDPNSDDRDWTREAWELILRDALGLDAPEPTWLDRPALTRFTASHPSLLKPFAAWNAGKPYADQIKPGNFLLVAHAARGGRPAGADPRHFALIAPYEPDPTRWERMLWHDVYDPSGPSYRISGDTIHRRRGHALPSGVVGVKTYRDVLDRYRTHAEPKSLDPDGLPCTRATVGLLSRRPVQPLSITHIGKEANLLEEIQAGLIGDEDEALIEYADAERDPWGRVVLPVLKEIPVARLARETGLDPTTIKRIRRGRVQPSPRSRALLTCAAASYAREDFGGQEGGKPPSDGLIACARYLADRPARVCPICGESPAGPRAIYCSRACRDRAYRLFRRKPKS